MIDCEALAAQIALYGAPIAALAQGLTAVAETLRLSELVSRVSGLEYGGYQGIEALPGTKRAPSRNTSAASSSS
jgi:hypothetical protein